MYAMEKFSFREYLKALKWKFSQDRIFVEASSLTYTTLLALVPLFTFVISLFSAFIVKPQMEAKLIAFLNKFFLPQSAKAIIIYLKEFSSKMKALSISGLIALGPLAFALFESVEGSLNKIWRAKKGRRFVNKIFVFTNFIFWLPLLLGLAIYLSYKFVKVQAYFALAISFMLVFFGFFIFNFIIPNRKVEIKAAIIASAFSSVMWLVAKHFLDIYVSNISLSFKAMKNIYGSLFIIPVFMIWVFFSWVIALSGSVLAFIVQFGPSVDDKNREMCNFWLAYEVLKKLYFAFKTGDIIAVEDLARSLGRGPEIIEKVLAVLHDVDLIEFSENEAILLKKDFSGVRADVLVEICDEELGHVTSHFISQEVRNKTLKDFLENA